MRDRIFIDSLRLKCKIGITDKERKEPQEVIVDISLFMNLKPAGHRDNIADTVNYREMIQRISEFAGNREFKLLESLAYGIATIALKKISVKKVIVKVRKSRYSNEPSIGIEVEIGRGPGSS